MENKMTPNEALEAIKHIYYYDEDINDGEHICIDLDEICKEELDIIDQALTEHEKQTQILKILKEKVVDIWEILNSVDYNDWLVCYKPTNKKYLLTKEEFDLLKEWLNEN